MKKIKFLLMTGFITSLLITSNSSIAMARDTNWTVGKTFSWAPYLNSTNVQNYSGKLQATANFKFDYVGEQHFNNSSINYFTFEINNESDGLLASTQYSNIPNLTMIGMMIMEMAILKKVKLHVQGILLIVIIIILLLYGEIIVEEQNLDH